MNIKERDLVSPKKWAQKGDMLIQDIEAGQFE